MEKVILILYVINSFSTRHIEKFYNIYLSPYNYEFVIQQSISITG